MVERRNAKVLQLTGDYLPDRALIGGKAWSICRMKSLGLPVPPAFVVTTNVCQDYLNARELSDALKDEVLAAVRGLEDTTGRYLGGEERPLLLSVRSGAPISMPGMMDTVLNLGMSLEVQKALAVESGSEKFAKDTHLRFLTLYSNIVLKQSITQDGEPEAILQSLNSDGNFESPAEQLFKSIEAVFSSWNSRRAKRYRKHNHISDELGTAVVVQAMVFGNLDRSSGTGVLFSRNPLTGSKEPLGEYLAGAQGEDVVSGTHTPDPLSCLAEDMPDIYDELLRSSEVLENENGDVQDIEFTVQNGELFLLQSRSAKRSPEAAVSFAVDMVEEGRISSDVALSRVTCEQVRTLLRPKLEDGCAIDRVSLVQGESACHGVSHGVVVLTSDQAELLSSQGQDVVLARETTSPDDLHGMIASTAVLTETGGLTSHAAVVGRALGVPCIVGCGSGSLIGLEGKKVTVDATSGQVFDGYLPVVRPKESDDPRLVCIKRWASDRCPIKVVERSSAVAEEVFDLDELDDCDSPEKIPLYLKGQKVVSGSVLDSGVGVLAAIQCGIETIVTDNPLAVTLAAIEANNCND